MMETPEASVSGFCFAMRAVGFESISIHLIVLVAGAGAGPSSVQVKGGVTPLDQLAGGER